MELKNQLPCTHHIYLTKLSFLILGIEKYKKVFKKITLEDTIAMKNVKCYVWSRHTLDHRKLRYCV